MTVARSHLEALERHPFDAVLLPLNYPMHQIPEYAADLERLREECRHRKPVRAGAHHRSGRKWNRTKFAD